MFPAAQILLAGHQVIPRQPGIPILEFTLCQRNLADIGQHFRTLALLLFLLSLLLRLAGLICCPVFSQPGLFGASDCLFRLGVRPPCFVAGQHGVTWPDLMRAEDIYMQLTESHFSLLPSKLLREVSLQRITRALEELGAVRLKQAKDTNRKNWRIWCLRPDKVALYELLGTGSALVEQYLRQQKSIGPGGSSSHLTLV